MTDFRYLNIIIIFKYLVNYLLIVWNNFRSYTIFKTLSKTDINLLFFNLNSDLKQPTYILDLFFSNMQNNTFRIKNYFWVQVDKYYLPLLVSFE